MVDMIWIKINTKINSNYILYKKVYRNLINLMVMVKEFLKIVINIKDIFNQMYFMAKVHLKIIKKVIGSMESFKKDK
jgi:hypothetical protein